jgi:hypothetical protein
MSSWAKSYGIVRNKPLMSEILILRNVHTNHDSHQLGLCVCFLPLGGSRCLIHDVSVSPVNGQCLLYVPFALTFNH